MPETNTIDGLTSPAMFPYLSDPMNVDEVRRRIFAAFRWKPKQETVRGWARRGLAGKLLPSSVILGTYRFDPDDVADWIEHIRPIVPTIKAKGRGMRGRSKP